MADNKVSIDIELVTQSFNKALTEATKSTDTFAKSASTSFSKVQGAFDVMKGTLAADAFKAAFGTIKDLFATAIAEAAESEKNIQRLNTALEQAGLYSKAASQDLQDFADSMSNASTYSDDAVLSATTLTASLTNLNTNGLKASTQLAMDLAATLGIDLQSANDMVIKGINGNTVAFNKMGIEVKKGSTDAERLANLQQALAKQAGSAAAATNTYSGATAQNQNAQAALLETLGKLFTESTAVTSSLKFFTNILQSANTFVSEHQTLVASLAIGLGLAAVGFTGVAVSATVTSGAFTALTAVATAAWTAITGPVGIAIIGISAVSAAAYALYKNWETVKAGAYSALAATLEFAAKGAEAIGASKVAKSLNDQAIAYKAQAAEIKLLAQAKAEADSKDAEKPGKDKAVNEERLKAEAEFQEAIKAKKLEAAISNEEVRLTEEAEELARKDAKFAKLVEDLGQEQAIRRQAELNMTTDKAGQENLRLQTQIDINKKRKEDAKKLLEDQKKLDEEQYNATKGALGNISGLMASHDRKAFEVGKAAAIANATMSMYEGIMKAWAAGPILGPILSVLVGAAGAFNIGRIAAQQPPKYEFGGIVPGSSVTGDSVMARVNSGEMVLSKTQQSNLLQLANNKSNSNSNGNVENLLVQLIDAVKSGHSIEIDGKQIISVVRDGMQSGRSIA